MKKRVLFLTVPVVTAVFTLILILWLLIPNPVYAANHTVGGVCGSSIQACINFAGPGDTVIVPAGTYNESLTLSQPISLTGVSSATTIIQALPGQRVLTVTGATIDNSVLIAGLTFSGGDLSSGNICFSGGTDNCGAGILLTGSAQPFIQNVIIENNTGYRGGGLYANETGGLILDRVIFRNNSVILTGGGLQAPNTPVTVTNSLFQENTTTENVGGAFSTGADFDIVAPIFISNTQFINNTAQCLGSIFSICHAPAMNTFDQNVTIVNSHFEGNICTRDDCDGGGLRLTTSFNGPSLTLSNTDFINNTAGGNGGGVIVGNLPQVTISNGRFQNNRALTGDGGGLNHGNFLLIPNSSINGTQFISNSAALDGGGAFSVNTIAVGNATFERNSSGNVGGGLMIDFAGSGSSLSSTDFLTNTAVSDGGGVYMSLNDLTINGGSFSGNSSGGSGGGLRAGTNLTLTNITVFSNTAVANGGGVFVNDGAVLVTNGRFENNLSQATPTFFSEGGGGLYAAGAASTLTVNNTDFVNNQAGALGGGIHALGSVTLTNGTFQNNTAVASNGGGIRTLGSLTVNGTQFTGNSAGFSGGGASANGPADVRNAFFQNNQADNGGGLGLADVGIIDNVQFINNSTITNTGGGLASFAAITISNSLFQGNASASSGGGLSGSFDLINLSNTQFLTNTAVFNGGGLNSSGNIAAVDVLLQGNDASNNGGGLSTSGTAFFSGSWLVSGNNAGADGGGVWANSRLDAVGGQIANNTAGGSGGGYYGGLSQLILNGTEFSGNQAGIDGGGAYAFDGNSVTGALFSNNTAQEAGGGLFLQRFVHITKTQFLGNAADLGGGLAVSRTNTGTFVQFMINNVFARNTAVTSGDGLYYNQPRPIDLIHNTFAQAAPTSGAAIHVVVGTVTATNNIIANFNTGIANVGGVVSSNFDLFFGNNSNTTGAVTVGNALTADPTFVDAAADDFRLIDGSPAVDSGTNMGVTEDILGNARPNDLGFDRGAYEGRFSPTAVSLHQFSAATPHSWGWLLPLLLLLTLITGMLWWQKTKMRKTE